MTNTTKILMLLALASILTGCDDGSNPEVGLGGEGGAGGVGASNPCLGPKAVVFSGSTTTLKAEVRALCVGWTATTPNGSYGFWHTKADCLAGMANLSSFSTAEKNAECSIPLTAAECADISHNFVDSVGVEHGLLVANNKLVGFFYLGGNGVDSSSLSAACTEDGTFLGLISLGVAR